MSILLYRRPDYVQRQPGPLNPTACQRYIERAQGGGPTVPPELSFDRIIDGETLPPCSLQDFMSYLLYVEHDAENLQFHLWLRAYTARFDALPEAQKALSPVWNPADAPLPPTVQRGRTGEKADAAVEELEDDDRRPSSPSSNGGSLPTSMDSAVRHATAGEVAQKAAADVGLKWEPFTIQPLRHEIALAIATYISPSSPRELNLSHRDRAHVLHALQHTTHPSAFAAITGPINLTLRHQSHPNFVRWAICNANRPRVLFVRGVGTSMLAAGFATALLCTLSAAPRWWRLFAVLGWFVGTAALVSSLKGLCLCLYAFGGRDLRPWEMDPASEFFLDTASGASVVDVERKGSTSTDTTAVAGGDEENLFGYTPSIPSGTSIHKTISPAPPRALDPLGGANSAREEEESWVARYARRGTVRKVFERYVWIQEEAVRVVHNRIVLSAVLWAGMVSVGLAVVFAALPGGGFF